MSEDKLKSFLEENHVQNYRLIKFEGSTMTVEHAQKQLNVPCERIVKSVVFMDDKGNSILGIVTGDKRISEEKLAKACGGKSVRMVEPKEVKDLTGYDVGAVPPIGFDKPIVTLIDSRVLSFDKIYAGGGARNALLEISSAELKRLSNAQVADISR